MNMLIHVDINCNGGMLLFKNSISPYMQLVDII